MPGREDCDSRQAGKELTHHTPCYCEENVYLLCQSLIKQGAVEELYVVFISNFEKKVLLRKNNRLLNQKDNECRGSQYWANRVRQC